MTNRLRIATIAFPLRPTQTFRRHLPVWVGLLKARGRPVGVYGRLGTHAVGVHRLPDPWRK